MSKLLSFMSLLIGLLCIIQHKFIITKTSISLYCTRVYVSNLFETQARVSDLDRYCLCTIKETSSTVYKNARIVHCHREVTLYHICRRVPN